MKLRIVALIKEKNQTVGFRLLDEVTGSIGDFKLEDAYTQFQHYGCANAKLENEKLVGTESSLDRLTVLNTKLEVIKGGGIIVLARLVRDTDTVGYRLLNHLGQKAEVNVEKAMELVKVHGVSNAKIMDGYLQGIKVALPVVKLESKMTPVEIINDIKVLNLDYETPTENTSKINIEIALYTNQKGIEDKLEEYLSKKLKGIEFYCEDLFYDDELSNKVKQHVYICQMFEGEDMGLIDGLKALDAYKIPESLSLTSTDFCSVDLNDVTGVLERSKEIREDCYSVMSDYLKGLDGNVDKEKLKAHLKSLENLKITGKPLLKHVLKGMKLKQLNFDLPIESVVAEIELNAKHEVNRETLYVLSEVISKIVGNASYDGDVEYSEDNKYKYTYTITSYKIEELIDGVKRLGLYKLPEEVNFIDSYIGVTNICDTERILTYSKSFVKKSCEGLKTYMRGLISNIDKEKLDKYLKAIDSLERNGKPLLKHIAKGIELNSIEFDDITGDVNAEIEIFGISKPTDDILDTLGDIIGELVAGKCYPSDLYINEETGCSYIMDMCSDNIEYMIDGLEQLNAYKLPKSTILTDEENGATDISNNKEIVNYDIGFRLECYHNMKKYLNGLTLNSNVRLLDEINKALENLKIDNLE